MKPVASRSPRRVLLALFAVCVAPLFLAWLLTSQQFGWSPEKHMNHGEFILPPRTLQLEGKLASDTPNAPDILRGKWTLFSLVPNNCTAACQYALTAMRNAQLALGKNVLRVQRAVVTQAHSPAESFLRKLQEAPLPIVFSTTATVFEELARQFTSSPTAYDPRDLYVADPMGRLVIHFPPNTRFVDFVADLKRLLAASSRG